MMFRSHSVVSRYAAALLAVASVAGCATMASTPEATVRARAAQQWKARVAGDFDTTYGFTTPSYRGTTTFQKYKGGFGDAVKIVSAEVADVKCESNDRCIVNTKVEAKPNLVLGKRAVPPFVTYVDETWLKEEGQWWLFPTP
jgi:hypothetical protein